MSYSFEEKLKYGKFKTLNEVHDAFVCHVDDTIDMLQTEVSDLEAELSLKEDQISDLEMDLKDTESDLDTLRDQCRALIKEIEYCIGELSDENRKDVQAAINAIED